MASAPPPVFDTWPTEAPNPADRVPLSAIMAAIDVPGVVALSSPHAAGILRLRSGPHRDIGLTATQVR